MTPQTGIIALALSSLLTAIRPISIRRDTKNNVPFLADSGMMRYMPILFVATQISRSLAWSWTTHQTPPDSGLRIAEDIIQNTFDGNFYLIIARFVDLNDGTKPNSHRRR